MFPSQPSLPESIPSISAEFSLPFSLVDTVVPLDLDSFPPVIAVPPEPPTLATPLPDLPVVRSSNRSHKPPSYLHD